VAYPCRMSAGSLLAPLSDYQTRQEHLADEPGSRSSAVGSPSGPACRPPSALRAANPAVRLSAACAQGRLWE